MGRDKPSESPRRIKSVQKAATIVDIIQRTGGATFSTLCEETDDSKGTTHTYLTTLEELGFVTKRNGVYRLGFRLVAMGEAARNRATVYQAGQEVVDTLSEETGEWVHLTVEQRGREITLYEVGGTNPVAEGYHHRTREKPQLLHQTASGKAMLACFSDSYVWDIIQQHGLEARTTNTITEPELFFEELDQIRKDGYAVNDEEEIRGMRSVGAAIQHDDSTVAGAVSMSGPTSRLSETEFTDQIPDLIVEAANVIEVNIETADFSTQ